MVKQTSVYSFFIANPQNNQILKLLSFFHNPPAPKYSSHPALLPFRFF